jgi:hypothetical protein
MANEKPVAVKNTILELCKAGRSQRQIALDLGIDRETVGRHIGLWRQKESNPAISTAGPEGAPPIIARSSTWLAT